MSVYGIGAVSTLEPEPDQFLAVSKLLDIGEQHLISFQLKGRYVMVANVFRHPINSLQSKYDMQNPRSSPPNHELKEQHYPWHHLLVCPLWLALSKECTDSLILVLQVET